ncbi:glutathione s-transferase [Trichoderma arundinaceum]|uniref:Glutathione s-transferase n=1 Tax=Trichoderma arundinaceum TaxID=490622 RepID=A0A395NYL1_TRIAR|nr:glutathione s-transferase [Trichoderma arundinaceum]
MSEQVILYDLPSRNEAGNRAWSPNTWKVRLVLNYKNVPYKTSWIEYPDIEPTFSSFGLLPNTASTGDIPYTVPVVKHSTAGYFMESFAIVKKLEELYPEPSLHLDNGYYDKAYAALQEFALKTMPELIHRLPTGILNDESIEYFQRTRKEWFGMSLAELSKSDKAGENAWIDAEPALQAMRALLMENSSGPYIAGEQVCYADFVIAGGYELFDVVHNEWFKRWIAYDECFQKHYEACYKWMTRNTF